MKKKAIRRRINSEQALDGKAVGSLEADVKDRAQETPRPAAKPARGRLTQAAAAKKLKADGLTWPKRFRGEILRRHREGKSVRLIAREMGVEHGSLYRFANEEGYIPSMILAEKMSNYFGWHLMDY